MRRRRATLAAVFAIATCAACNSILGIVPLDTGDGGAAGDASVGADASADVNVDVNVNADVSAPPSDAPFDALDGMHDAGCGAGACLDAEYVVAPCDDASPCGAQATCFQGVCHGLCSDASPCAAPNASCVHEYDPTNGSLLPTKLCALTCDLEHANACGLVPSRDGGTVSGCVYDHYLDGSDCQMVGHGTGDCPNGYFDCAPGTACLGMSAGGSACRAWCPVDASPDLCEAGLTCAQTDITVFEDGHPVGICQ